MASSTILRPEKTLWVPQSAKETRSLFRIGKPRPDTTFLRQFPGKRRFERVSEDDWNAKIPHKDIAGFGHIATLEADVRVWSPKKQLQSCRKWPSRSYIRNFARILRNMFGQSVQLVDRNATLLTTLLNSASGVTGSSGLIPQILVESSPGGTQANPEDSGACFAIGDGVAAEVHTRNDLVNRVSGLISARQGLVTTVLTTATTTLQITAGIVNGSAASVSITEIGLYLFVITTGTTISISPFSTLLAYDGIASTPVASGGVIAPRYTLDFPI